MNYELKLSNRQKKLTATKSKFWCIFCDRAKVGQLGRCPICKKRNSKKMPIELSEDIELNKKIVVNLSRGKTVVWFDDE